ncbi:MAG: twin-arginine translocation signal domain-containing protein [Limisphaerales bacterium]
MPRDSSEIKIRAWNDHSFYQNRKIFPCRFTRRDFVKMAGLAAAGLSFPSAAGFVGELRD